MLHKSLSYADLLLKKHLLLLSMLKTLVLINMFVETVIIFLGLDQKQNRTIKRTVFI